MPAAKIIGPTDPATQERVRMRKIEDELILSEFDTMQDFYEYLSQTGQSRTQWVRDSILPYAVEDAFAYLLEVLLPRGE